MRKLITRHIRLLNFKPYTQISRKLCYQTRKGFWSSFKTSKLPTLPYLLLFFEIPQTFTPFSPFPPSTNTPHPSPSLSKKNHTRRSHQKLLSPKPFKTLPPAYSPCPMGVEEIPPSNSWPFHPSRTNESWKWFALQWILGWEFLCSMKHSKCSIL